jgi:hypothetical protein
MHVSQTRASVFCGLDCITYHLELARTYRLHYTTIYDNIAGNSR